jgi:DUF3079 family protein
MARIPLQPSHPDRICWGCDKYCPADDLACGNGTIRTLHPAELFGADWIDWVDARAASTDASDSAVPDAALAADPRVE